MNIIYQTAAASTPSISSSSTALAANPRRLGWIIQNLGTNPLYILCGTGASTTVFTVVAAKGTTNDDGTGMVVSMESGVVYTGIITVAGTSPRYTATEWAPGT